MNTRNFQWSIQEVFDIQEGASPSTEVSTPLLNQPKFGVLEIEFSGGKC